MALAPGVVLNTWTGAFPRPSGYSILSPVYLPTAIPIVNTGTVGEGGAANWLLCVATWRQDAGQAATVFEETTVNIRDDAHNFWLPLSTPPAPTAQSSAIVQQAVWIAPAARAANYVYVSPTGYQQSLLVQVFEISAACPWYLTAVQQLGTHIGGTSITETFTPTSGLFAIGVLSYDNNSVTPTITATGWTLANNTSTTDGTDHISDLTTYTYYAHATGSALTLSATFSGSVDSACTLITAPGIFTPISMPWTWSNPAWPIVITEIGSGSYVADPDDQIVWTDISVRNGIAPDGGMTISREVQYEDQTLTAGTLTCSLDNADAAFTPNNPASPFYPVDTDIPFRVRAVWPLSANPYGVLFSGYTDQIEPQWDPDDLRGWVAVTAVDAWSRLTASMQNAAVCDYLDDSPYALWDCSDAVGSATAANGAPGGVAPLVQQQSKYGAGGTTAAFGADSLELPGDPGATGWQLTGLTASGQKNEGYSLVHLPTNPATLPSIASGVTVEFWLTLAQVQAGVNWNGVLAAAIGAKNPLWTLTINATTGAIIMTVWDKITQATTATTINALDWWNQIPFVTVAFNETNWTVRFNAGSPGGWSASGTCDFSSVYNGFVFNGLNVPYAGLAGQCVNATYQGIAIYPEILPQARSVSHYQISDTAAVYLSGVVSENENDTERIARVVGYGGIIPPLAMRGSDLIGNNDLITGITDTSGQISSAYATNIASSTLAMMTVDATGALQYRRRYEWYDRSITSWSIGDSAVQIPLNNNPFFASNVVSWSFQNGATGVWTNNPALPAEFFTAARWSGNGSTSFPQMESGSYAVSQGSSYYLVSSWYSPQGYSQVNLIIQWLNSSFSVISTSSANAVLGANMTSIVTTAPARAPAGAVWANIYCQANGTPANTVQFYNGTVMLLAAGQVPYLGDLKMSLDRAQVYNAAVVTQYGTSTTVTTNGASGTSTQNSSGVTVRVENNASAAKRGSIPLVATSYEANTQQLSTYQPAYPCVEDYADWVTNVQSGPLLRGEKVTIDPASNLFSWNMAVQADIGDGLAEIRSPGGYGVLLYDQTIRSRNPAAWWRLNDVAGSATAADYTSNGFSATASNVFFGDSPGAVAGNDAALFSSASPSSALSSFNPTSTTGFSVEAWVNLAGLTQSGSPRIVSNSKTDTDFGGFELMLNGGTNPQIYFGNGTTAGNVLSGSALPTSGWHHLVGTWDGTTIRLYVDGLMVGTAAFSGNLAAGTATGVGIGYEPSGSTSYLNAEVAEVTLYGFALTSNQVVADYAAAQTTTDQITINAWVSAINHTIDFKSGTWTVDYTPTTNPNASVLRCDDPVCGVLDGSNYIGW